MKAAQSASVICGDSTKKIAAQSRMSAKGNEMTAFNDSARTRSELRALRHGSVEFHRTRGGREFRDLNTNSFLRQLQASSPGRNQLLAPEVVRGFERLAVYARFAGPRQNPGHVGGFHETVPGRNTVESRGSLWMVMRSSSGLSALPRLWRGDDLLVQHLVVLEMVQEHDWGALRIASHEHRQAGTRAVLAVRRVGEQQVDRQHPRPTDLNDLAPRFHVVIRMKMMKRA